MRYVYPPPPEPFRSPHERERAALRLLLWVFTLGVAVGAARLVAALGSG